MFEILSLSHASLNNLRIVSLGQKTASQQGDGSIRRTYKLSVVSESGVKVVSNLLQKVLCNSKTIHNLIVKKVERKVFSHLSPNTGHLIQSLSLLVSDEQTAAHLTLTSSFPSLTYSNPYHRLFLFYGLSIRVYCQTVTLLLLASICHRIKNKERPIFLASTLPPGYNFHHILFLICSGPQHYVYVYSSVDHI